MAEPRSVIITGAGSGIGAAVAEAFAEAGDRVFLAELSKDRLDQTVESIGSGNVWGRPADVTDRAAIGEFAAWVVEQTGRIDVLVSNAGVFDGVASITETGSELWDKVIGINLTGCFNSIKAVTGQMIAQRRGRIITIGSIAATRAIPDGIAYCAAKAGLEGLTRRLAVDLSQYGVTANVVAPGVIKTGIRANSEEILGDLVQVNRGVGASADLMDLLIPAKRGGSPAEIAATVFFLASEGAAYISGDVVHVDGGWIAS